MSLQLILYPQNFQGQYSTVSTPYFTEYVSDFSYNLGLSGAGFSGSAVSQSNVLTNLTPLNIWQQYNVTGGGFTSANAATFASGKVTLDSASSTSLTGIYQLISNLQIGSTYVLNIERLAGTTGVVTIGHSSNFTVSNTVYEPILFTTLSNTVGTHTFTFTATNTDMVFLLNYVNDDNTNLEIGSVSIKESIGSAPTVDVFKDGQIICDLYDENSIPLTLSIDDFKNVHEKKQSFSKPFKLPATKRNNQIFSSLFDVTKSVKDDVFSFNPYRKTKSILKEDGYTIFDGYLRLIDIVEKEGEISYNVNLYSETITLLETLKDKKFSDIDFSELLHEYNRTQIAASFEDNDGVTLANSLPTSSFAYNATLGSSKTDVIKYPFCKWNGDTYYNTVTSKVDMLKLEDAFRPFINCKYLLNRIVSDAGFTYESDFLDSTDFTKLFMDFNWGEGVTPANPHGYQTMTITSDYTPSSSFNNINFTNGSIPNIYDTSTKKFTSTQDNLTISGIINLFVLNSGATETLKIRVIHKDSSGNTIRQETATHTVPTVSTIPIIKTKSFNFTVNDTDTLELQTFVAGSSNITIDQEYFDSSGIGITLNTNVNVLVSSDVEMLEAFNIARGDLGQYEFFKGLVNMFNLVVIQDKNNNNNLIIEPYNNVFIDDTQSQHITHTTHDWTSKVDISEIKYKPLSLKKEISFEFIQENDDYAKKIYKSFTGNDYGKKIKPNTNLTVLDGEENVKATPFGSTFIKPIFSNVTTSDFIVPVIYKGNEDGTFTGFKNKPRILFNNGKVTLNEFYVMPAQNGVASTNINSFLQFTHLTDIPTTQSTKDYNFETQQQINTIGNTTTENLYNIYWSSYYDELYNPDTRQVNMKVYLTPSDLNNFEFYDKVRIKNREYRVNKIDYRPYELSNVEFILIA